MRRRRRARPVSRRRIRTKRIVKIAAAVGLIVVFFIFVSVKLKPVMQSVTSNIAKQMMISSINNVVLKELDEKQYGYDDFVNVERDNEGNIIAISLNMVNVNTLKSNISLTIQESLGDSQQQTGVPLGTLLGADLLRGHGPRIPLRISVLGNINVDLRSAFDSAGINQTRHQIYLDITTGVYSYITGVSATTDITTSVPVAETVIVGEVPQTYANLTPDSNLQGIVGTTSGS